MAPRPPNAESAVNQTQDIELKSISLSNDVDAEEPLLALECRIQALYRSAAESGSDEYAARIGQEIDELESEIRQSVPITLAGIAVKVRHLWNSARVEGEPEDDLNLRTTLEALSQLADCANEAAGRGSNGPAESLQEDDFLEGDDLLAAS